MKTFSAKASEVPRKWWIIDAKDQVLGRVADLHGALDPGEATERVARDPQQADQPNVRPLCRLQSGLAAVPPEPHPTRVLRHERGSCNLTHRQFGRAGCVRFRLHLLQGLRQGHRQTPVTDDKARQHAMAAFVPEKLV